MRTLNEYINSNDEFFLTFESLENQEEYTLENVYESLFNQLFNEYQINEKFNLFGKIGNVLSKMGDKAKTGGENLDRKIEGWSEDAKKAYRKAKEIAGDAWGDIKDVFGDAVGAIDGAITATKDHITDIAKQFKINPQQLINKIATKLTTIIASNSKLGKQLITWTTDPEKYKAQLAAFTSLSAAMIEAINVQYDKDMIMDVYKAAFMKSEE